MINKNTGENIGRIQFLSKWRIFNFMFTQIGNQSWRMTIAWIFWWVFPNQIFLGLTLNMLYQLKISLLANICSKSTKYLTIDFELLVYAQRLGKFWEHNKQRMFKSWLERNWKDVLIENKKSINEIRNIFSLLINNIFPKKLFICFLFCFMFYIAFLLSMMDSSKWWRKNKGTFSGI